MIYAVKFGPVHVGDDRTNVFLGFTEELLLPPVLAQTDEEGLWALLSYGPSEPSLCEPGLDAAGRPLGFTPIAAPEEFREPIATMALTTALGPSVGVSTSSEVLLELARAGGVFSRAEPWETWHSDQAVRVHFDGAITAEYEMSIMGSGGNQYGIILYEEIGAIARTNALVVSGREAEARRFPFLSFALENAPLYALRALGDLGVADVPVPFNVRGGKPVPATELELLMLAAAARAMATLTRSKLEGCAAASADDLSITAKVHAPASERVR